MNPRFKWYGLIFSVLIISGSGLMLGKLRERDYVSDLYQRHDFTLLDDKGEFFRLQSLPERKLALLVFTPDGIPPTAVKPFYDFSKHLGDLSNQGIETYLVSASNRDIARNFKNAAGFSSRLLLDTGGTVGRNAGVREGIGFMQYWAYALVDKDFRLYWSAKDDQPLKYEELITLLKKAR